MPVGSDQLAYKKKMFNLISLFLKKVIKLQTHAQQIKTTTSGKETLCRIVYCKKYSFSELARSVVEESLVESGQPLGILKTLRQSTRPGDGILPRVSYWIIF